MKELKFLYETTIDKVVEKPQIETQIEQGQKVEIKRTIKTLQPIKIAILKPDRKLFKNAEMFYAKSLSDYLKAGLLPYSLVAKRYANDGGPLTEQEKGRLKELRIEAQELEKEFFGVIGDDKAKQDQKNGLLVKINKINAEISTIQNAYSDIFDSTAEIKARNDTVEWWSLFLIYANEDGNGYKPIFSEGTYEERIAKLEDYEDVADPFYVELIKRLSYLISFWFTARESITSIDFKTMERLYIDTMSEYKPQASEGLTISEPSPKQPEPVAEPAPSTPPSSPPQPSN